MVEQDQQEGLPGSAADPQQGHRRWQEEAMRRPQPGCPPGGPAGVQRATDSVAGNPWPCSGACRRRKSTGGIPSDRSHLPCRLFGSCVAGRQGAGGQTKRDHQRRRLGYLLQEEGMARAQERRQQRGGAQKHVLGRWYGGAGLAVAQLRPASHRERSAVAEPHGGGTGEQTSRGTQGWGKTKREPHPGAPEG